MQKRWKVDIEINASAQGVDLDRWRAVLQLSPRVLPETASVVVTGPRIDITLIVWGERNERGLYGPDEALKSALVLLRRSSRRMHFTHPIMDVIRSVHIAQADLTPVPAIPKGSE